MPLKEMVKDEKHSLFIRFEQSIHVNRKELDKTFEPNRGISAIVPGKRFSVFETKKM